MTAEDLRLAREGSANVAYQTFTKHITENKEGLFSFYEGKDAPYYYSRIKQVITNRKNYPIICKGKSMVIKVYELINNHREYDKYLKVFFVDRDFDSSIKGVYPDIFETPCYSIENLYVNKSSFEEILKHELSLSEVDDSFENCIDCFNDRIAEMLDALELFNAWYFCLKQKAETDKLKTGVSLNEKFPKGYIDISLNKINRNYDLNNIRNDFKNAIFIAEDDINIKIQQFQESDRLLSFRGKYLLEFFHKFIQLLVEDANTNQNILKTKLKFHAELSQFISLFSQYAETPATLIEYLNQRN